MLRYLDETNSRLVYFGQKASARYWDQHWNLSNFNKRVKSQKTNRYILNTTQKFLKKGKILEGGCGLGSYVYCLHHHGYQTYGVDYSQKTVKKINQCFPKLKVSFGDVRSLKFPDRFFDGYWSLGVIEHYYQGFKPIIKEAKRVLKKGGYFFLAFPYMSPWRKFKAKIGLYDYKKYNQERVKKQFYQFVLDQAAVKQTLENQGFAFLESQSYDGLKGYKEEVKLFKPIMQKIYDYQGKNLSLLRLRGWLNYFLAFFSAHMILMIFQNNTKSHQS